MFDDIIMSDNARESLYNFFSSGTLPHAVILEGTTEDNRLKCAKLVAAAFECESDNVPCGECRHCKKILLDVHPDVIVCEKDDSKSTMGVEIVRQMKTDAYISTNEGENKVYIFREAQDMTVQSQNAVLKIFEEPPQHVKIIMTCDSKASLLETIISRGTVITLGEAESQTQSDAVSAKAEKKALELCRVLAQSNELEFMKQTGILEKDKNLLLPVVECMGRIFASAARVKSGAKPTDESFREISEFLSRRFTLRQLLIFNEKMNDIREAIKYNANRNLTITRLSSIPASFK